jgi:hypothetical protein
MLFLFFEGTDEKPTFKKRSDQGLLMLYLQIQLDLTCSGDGIDPLCL